MRISAIFDLFRKRRVRFRPFQYPDTYREICEMKTPISHILTKAAQLPKNKQGEFLAEHPRAQLIAGFLHLALNEAVKWNLPEGDPPYKPAEHDEWGILAKETRRMNIFLVGGGYDEMKQSKREKVFIEILESVHADDAKLLLLLKDKKLPEGLDAKSIIKAFPGIDGK